MGQRKKRNRSARRQLELDAQRMEKRMRRAHQASSAFGRTRSRAITDADKIGPAYADTSYRDQSERSKALELCAIVRDIFAIKSVDGLLQVTRSPDPSLVARVAGHVLEMWPKDFVIPPLARRHGCSVLYLGERLPNHVCNVVTRLALYADRIVLPNRFANMFLHHPQRSPFVRPAEWWVEYCKYALGIALLEPWIRADVVELVCNPLVFDSRMADDREGRDITSRLKLSSEQEKELIDRSTIPMFAEALLNTEEAAWEDSLKAMGATPAFSAQAIAEARQLRKSEPIRVAIPLPDRSAVPSEMIAAGAGLPYDLASVIAREAGADLVSGDVLMTALMAADAGNFTSQTAIAAQMISNAKLNFLNDVSVDRAVGLRSDGVLSEFRSYLATVTRGLSLRSHDGSFNHTSLREFEERFTAEYTRYKHEWVDVQKKLIASTATTLTGTALAGLSAWISGRFEIVGVCAPLIAQQGQHLVNTVFERRKMERNPLNIVLQLDRTR